MRDFDDIMERGLRLAGLTTFGIGGPAAMLGRPRSVEELGRLLSAAAAQGLAVRVLGAGSNVLVADEGVEGLVVKMAGREFSQIRYLPGGVECGGAVTLPRLVREAAEAGLSGMECLAGIPGSIGGALAMNAGGRYGCMADAVRDVEVMDRHGVRSRLGREDAGFSYRTSRLRGLVVTGCTLKLTPDNPDDVKSRTAAVLDEKRKHQPLGAACAGCVFRNPAEGPPAGRLIEELGFKGQRVGGAAVSDRHANFIVNTGRATCGDVLELVDKIRVAALAGRGTVLDLELDVWS